jgi:peptidoglycan pentaglycine glycine transferase (the first glycine)
MEVKIAENRQEWDSWFLSQGIFEFLQSWEWGEFQERTGKEVLRLQCLDDGVVKAQVQGFFCPLRGSLSYISIPRAAVSKKTLDALKKYFAHDKNIVFLRIERIRDCPLEYSYKTVPCRQPQHTLILNIEKPMDELLEGMHTKTRYNIRLSQKKGVEVNDEKNIDVFWELNKQTTERDGFKSHEKEYYEKMLLSHNVYQLNAVFEEKTIASILLIEFGKRCTYLHGASSDEHRNLMAPYLLQWSGIQFAQVLRCSEYDFWGIAPMVVNEVDANAISFHDFKWEGNHRFSGVTRFKVGFGGTVKDYPEAIEIPLQKWKYQLYRIAKKLRG